MAPVISTNEIEMHFSGCDALRGVNLAVRRGTVFALLGENGAGKTTLIRILTGFQPPSSGTARVCGMDPTRQALEIRRRIGYVSDSPTMYDWMKVDEIGWFTAGFYPDGYLEGYRDLIGRYELPPTRRIRELSKGQRAKVALSLALAHDPELLILDEPTSGLDPLVRREFLESMIDRAATGRTVLLSSHQISEVERVADEIAIVHQGRVQLTGVLADLRQSISEVTVKLHDPLTTLPSLTQPSQILSEQTSGRQRRMIVRDLTPENEALLSSSYGVFDVAHRSASLEELFVACTRGVDATKAIAAEHEAAPAPPVQGVTP
ncbi:ABC transporter ATP-binding protein [Allorhodopirellula solitaria]|uniref:ABC transporter ATP-binding protein n=1 Tax=Allorhodopirellula solitaria TaxID=2527987 RepID=UPI001FE5CC71|nr:ABC transporter ATP-binding protein [Allorhodopirellula solitaria]